VNDTDLVPVHYVQNEFEARMGLNSGKILPALSQWVQRRLQKHNWSIRAESVSQKVPTNWFQVAIDSMAKLRNEMKNVNVMINADEVFINFYPRETKFVVPKGTKRVGSNRASDSKKGCTLMVSCEYFSSKVLPPFIVMTGKHDGTLSRRFSSWIEEGGDAKIAFQKSHWMDVRTAKVYLDFIISLYPEDATIGLIWDAASSHICDEVKAYAAELGIVLGFIPAGLTSILQVCDLYCNKPIKGFVKSSFLRWKVSQPLPPGGKYKVDRKQVIGWIEESIVSCLLYTSPSPRDRTRSRMPSSA